MKYAQSTATAAATFFFMFMIFVVYDGTNQVAEAQSWNAPSYAANAAVGGCYDETQRFFDNTAENYELRRDRNIRNANEHEIILSGIIIVGSTTAVAVPGPWSIPALISGTVSVVSVQLYYNSKRNGYMTTYNNQMSALRTAADQRISACDTEHLNGGDPENDTDEPEMQNSGNGVNIVGGSQSVGNPRGRVTGYPVGN